MSDHLTRGLHSRHVQMMALGGAIGAGIFQGSAETLAVAGPGVVIAYLISGLLLFVVMGALAEMATVYPQLDLRGLIRKALGARVSFVVGWLYWMNWIVIMALEMVVAGTLLHYWFPGLPVWLLSLLVAVSLISLNLFGVRFFGEIEYWLTGIKIAMLIIFILLGSALLFGFIPDHAAPYFQHYTEHGGFFPKGWTAVLSAMLIVIFSYGGTELIGISLTETKNVQQVLPKMIRGVILRICLFYIAPVFIICGLVPWDEISSENSPFIQVLSAAHFTGASHIMNFVILAAVISAANSGMYATSRILFSLAKDGEAPKRFTRLTKQGVPSYGLVFSSAGLLLGSIVAFLSPDAVFQYLMGIPGFTVLILWLTICIAQMKIRKQYPATPLYRVWAQPASTVLTAVSLFIILLFIVFDPNHWIKSTICLGVISFLYILSARKAKKEERDSSITSVRLNL